MNPSAAFLSLDGIDGTGKSTQIARLVERLQSLKLPVTSCIDPGGTPLGKKLREILLESRATSISPRSEALLFMASRAELVAEVIAPALYSGSIVVSDRYLLANVVYQGYAGGMPVPDLWTIGQFCTLGIQPDLTLLLDMPIEAAKQRRGRPADRLESCGDSHDQRVREGFLHEASRHPDRIKVIDASGSVDQVHAAIWAETVRLLQAKGYRLEHES